MRPSNNSVFHEAKDKVIVFRLNSPESCADAEHWLNDDDRLRRQRLTNATDRQLFSGSHILLNYCLWLATGGKFPPLTALPSGKPVIPGRDNPHFNLSHCTGQAICAISWHFPVGVDVECCPSLPDPDVLQLVFCKAEQDFIGRDGHRFGMVWTLKEALFKASGELWDDHWRDRSVLDLLEHGRHDGYCMAQREFDNRAIASIVIAAERQPEIDWIDLNHCDFSSTSGKSSLGA